MKAQQLNNRQTNMAKRRRKQDQKKRGKASKFVSARTKPNMQTSPTGLSSGNENRSTALKPDND